MDENKWEYDYSSSNNPAGDTGYPNVGSSGMNTANTASTFSESTQPSGGATPPPAGPQNTAPAAPKKPKKSKFLMDDDDVDVDSLARSVGGESTASDVVENFVAAPSSSPH